MNKIKAPKNPSEISVEWLREMLINEPSANKIVSIEIDKNFGPASLLGKAVRVKINYADEECEPKSVIVKFQVSCSEPKKEGEVYRILSGSDMSYIPKVFGVFGNGNLILEDLSDTHSVIEVFTIDQVRNVVSGIADFNIRFFGDTRFPKDDLSHFINSININFGQSWDIFRDRYQKHLGSEIADFEWAWKNAETVSRQYNSNPTTLSHGDVNRSNLLFPNDRSDSPVFIDWQLSGQRIIPFDLAYFLVKNLSVEQRREHESMLLKEYYEKLSGHIQSQYSFEHLVLDYRSCITRSMLSAVMRVGPKFENHLNRFESADKLAIRVIEAVKDLKPVEAIQELQKRGLLKS